ncbi:hypothetical protein MJO28_013264 [Puccinia striiformis f. sp. tritici]|uniref:Uncharacterized protein n=1 Tax=Puccinia striiformis f. sp. tritici TaxID=168172 RepID=A0ACC0DZV7_9BASI|nr:hypothetical protein MJO28_013264 [Puccinia striiformis f. sp. tritici]KAI7942988.1 hypothetical protein MJO29_012832 [Puccinia striiformis f. sp. tritici]
MLLQSLPQRAMPEDNLLPALAPQERQCHQLTGDGANVRWSPPAAFEGIHVDPYLAGANENA